MSLFSQVIIMRLTHLGSNRNPSCIEDLHRDLEALPLLSQQVPLRDINILNKMMMMLMILSQEVPSTKSHLKDDVGSGRTPDSKFCLLRTQAQTRGREGDIEATDPLAEQEKN